MAEQSGDKTHDPTPHRRQQAREQGQTAFSQDLGSAVLLIVGAGMLLYWGRDLAETSARLLRQQLQLPLDGPLETGDVVLQLRQQMRSLASVLLPLLLALLGAAIGSSVMQTGFLFLTDKLRPDPSRLSPLAGIQRILSLQGAMRLSFGMFKVVIVALVGGAVIYQSWDEVVYAGSLSLPELAGMVAHLTITTALWVGVALFLLALFDYSFQRWKHEQDLKMTHQEIREEMKNLQGDPQIIARRRSVQRQLALNRIGDKVPGADVVVTNPTELAIAIRYDPETMAAPVVAAKGAGVLAQRIRRLALENQIPIVERKPLARLLYKEVEVGHPIPDESYAAVAEVLAYVYQLKGKRVPGAA
jgi:flagellar biosynthetic protein FlhB